MSMNQRKHIMICMVMLLVTGSVATAEDLVLAKSGVPEPGEEVSQAVEQ